MDQALTDYVLGHIEPEPEWLRRLDRDANLRLMNPRMNSGHLQGRLLKMFTLLTRPRRVLELGTFGGYSALCIAEGLEQGLHIQAAGSNIAAGHCHLFPGGNLAAGIHYNRLQAGGAGVNG